MSRWKWILLVVVILIIAAQFIRPHLTNPPVDPTKTLGANAQVPPNVAVTLERACRDCHSNVTVLPWYDAVAPVSWLLASDVNEGRRNMNLSEWGTYPPQKRVQLLQKICKEVKGGDMPPWDYVIMHGNAKLTDADRQAICAWTATEAPRAGASR